MNPPTLIQFTRFPFFSGRPHDAHQDEHVTCMYPLLPTMQGTNAHIIEQAIVELSDLYRDDEVTDALQTGRLDEIVVATHRAIN